MPTNADLLLLDTSAAIAFVDTEHEAHSAVMAATQGHELGLAGHAAVETYSVLTRLPAPKRLSGSDALRVITTNFPGTRHLDAQTASKLLAEFAAAGITGGSVYDALVGAVARAHRTKLLTCDARARPTYSALGVATELAHA